MTKLWLKAAGVRALKTVAQTALSTIGVSVAISDVNWAMVISIALLAGLMSLLTSIKGLPEVKLGAALQEVTDSAAGVLNQQPGAPQLEDILAEFRLQKEKSDDDIN